MNQSDIYKFVINYYLQKCLRKIRNQISCLFVTLYLEESTIRRSLQKFPCCCFVKVQGICLKKAIGHPSRQYGNVLLLILTISISLPISLSLTSFRSFYFVSSLFRKRCSQGEPQKYRVEDRIKRHKERQIIWIYNIHIMS